MNALFELLGEKYSESVFNNILRMGTNLDDYDITSKTDIYGTVVHVLPKWQATATKEWFKRIKFAKVECGEITLVLPSSRTEEDEKAFYDGLASINYDNGYGGQELFGIIAYNDGTWLDRGEYDGSEWWEGHQFPQEKDYIQ